MALIPQGGLVELFHELPDPWKQVFHITGVRFKQVHEKPVGFLVLNCKVLSIDPEKNIACEKCDPFVPINEWVVHHEGLEEGGRHFAQV